MPDIDIDFADDRRHEVIEYVVRKYGTDRVTQIITFNTFGARGTIRDVGRVMDLPLDVVDTIAKLVPQQLGMTLERALTASPELKERYQEDIRRYFPSLDLEQAKAAEGFAIFYGEQAAGILLGKREGESLDVLLDYTTPAYRDCSVGSYLYGALPAHGVSSLRCMAESPEHIQYVEKMGFARQADQSYTKSLK